MGKLEPLFVDITWGAGGSTSDLTLELRFSIKLIERNRWNTYFIPLLQYELSTTVLPRDTNAFDVYKHQERIGDRCSDTMP